MFNKEQLKYLLENTKNINYESFYKSDLITMIKILREKIDELKEVNKNGNRNIKTNESMGIRNKI